MPFLRRGNITKRIITNNRMNAPAPQANSLTSGAIGLGPLSSVVVSASPVVWGRWTTTAWPAPVMVTVTVITVLLEAGEDEDDEADEGERLGEGDAEEHRRADHAGGLWLASHGLDGLADDVTDADARADRGKTVGETSADGGVGSFGFTWRLHRVGVSDEAGDCFHVVSISPCQFFWVNWVGEDVGDLSAAISAPGA